MVSFDETVPPGQEGSLRTKVKTRNLHGSVRKAITLTTNDPERPTRTLTVAMRVVGSVAILPRNRVVLTDRQGSRMEQRLVVRKDETEVGTLLVRNVRPSESWLRVDARKLDEAEPPRSGAPHGQVGDWVFDVSLAEMPKQGNHRAEIRFETGLPREPEVTIPVTALVRPLVFVSSSRLVLPEPSPGSPASVTVKATASGGTDPESLVIVAEPEAFQVQTERSGPRALTVRVSLEHSDEFPRRGILWFRRAGRSTQVPITVEGPARP